MSIKQIMNQEIIGENTGNVTNGSNPANSHRPKSQLYKNTLVDSHERWSQALLVESPDTIIDNKVSPSVQMSLVIQGMKNDIKNGSFFNVIGDGGNRQNDVNQVVYAYIISTKNHSLKVMDKVKVSDDKNQNLTKKSGFLGEVVWVTKAIQLMKMIELDYEKATIYCDNELAVKTLSKVLAKDEFASNSVAVQMWMEKEVQKYLLEEHAMAPYAMKFEKIHSRTYGKAKGLKQNAMGFMCDNATNLISGTDIHISNSRNSHFTINDKGELVRIDKKSVSKDNTYKYIIAQSMSEARHLHETRMGVVAVYLGAKDLNGYKLHTGRTVVSKIIGTVLSVMNKNTAEQSKLFDSINQDDVIINFKQMIQSK